MHKEAQCGDGEDKEEANGRPCSTQGDKHLRSHTASQWLIYTPVSFSSPRLYCTFNTCCARVWLGGDAQLLMGASWTTMNNFLAAAAVCCPALVHCRVRRLRVWPRFTRSL